MCSKEKEHFHKAIMIRSVSGERYFKKTTKESFKQKSYCSKICKKKKKNLFEDLIVLFLKTFGTLKSHFLLKNVMILETIPPCQEMMTLQMMLAKF